MENTDRKTLDQKMRQKRYLVLLFASAMDVNSVLAENSLTSLEEEYGDVCTFCRSDIAQDVELAHQYSVYSVPRILVFEDGRLVDDVTGAMSHGVMKAVLDKHIGR